MRKFYPKNGRVILHVDMNSFFASVEMAKDPSLKGKPLAIAGDETNRRGIIVTSNYEARKYGIKTTMPVWEAKKLCKHLTFRKPNMELYKQTSQQIFDHLKNWTELVEQVSIDEAYIDITDCYNQGSPLKIAQDMQTSLMELFDLPCSIGIAPNKYLAKLASDMKKPLGITVLRKRDLPEKIWPLSITEMHGVGQKTAEKLNDIQIFIVKDLIDKSDHEIEAALGIRGLKLKEYAKGNDQREVDPNAAAIFKSVGTSTTLPQNMTQKLELEKVLQQLCAKVALRLKNKGYVSQNISITIRYKNRKEHSKSKMLINPIVNEAEIYPIVKQLFHQLWTGDAVRLLGVTAQKLIENHQAQQQLDLFSYEKEAQKEPLYKAIEQIKSKYGESIVQKGGEAFRNKRG